MGGEGGAIGAGPGPVPAARGQHRTRLGSAMGKQVLPRLKNFKYAGKSGPHAPAEPSPAPARLRTGATGAKLGPYWQLTTTNPSGNQASAWSHGRSGDIGMWGHMDTGIWGHRDTGIWDRGKPARLFPHPKRHRDGSENPWGCIRAPHGTAPLPPASPDATATIPPANTRPPSPSCRPSPWGSRDRGGLSN